MTAVGNVHMDPFFVFKSSSHVRIKRRARRVFDWFLRPRYSAVLTRIAYNYRLDVSLGHITEIVKKEVLTA